MQPVKITESISAGAGLPLVVIAGPCQIESFDHCMMIQRHLAAVCGRLGLPFIFKSSYDKANRTSLSGRRGVGLEEGLQILERVRQEGGAPVLTDVHSPEEARAAGEAVDVLQTPAFLCRQTDLLLAAGATGKTVNVKKGQFLSAGDMRFAAEKIASTGNHRILLCERGTCFGYHDLVVDMRGLVTMRNLGYPVVFDATHSVQSMGGKAGCSGGSREFIAPLAKAAVAVGIDALFLECHEDPSKAPSDGASMLPLIEAEPLLRAVQSVRAAAMEAAELS